MTVNVIPISEDTPVREVVGLLLKYRIRAVLVVDGNRFALARSRL
jgi:CBS domain-containing protein